LEFEKVYFGKSIRLSVFTHLGYNSITIDICC